MIVLTITITELPDGGIGQLVENYPNNPTDKERSHGANILAAIDDANGGNILKKALTVSWEPPPKT